MIRLGYLRVGDRGWVFDMGIAGPWVSNSVCLEPDRRDSQPLLVAEIGVPVVAAVTGPNAMK